MTEQMKMDFDESVVVPDIDEIKTIPEEELPEFDIDAKDIRFDDEVFLQEDDEETLVEEEE